MSNHTGSDRGQEAHNSGADHDDLLWRERPFGISLLAMLHTFCAFVGWPIALLIIFLMFSSRPEVFEEAQSAAPGALPAFLFAGVVVWVLQAIAAIGMWRGARWGWWSAALLLTYGLVRRVFAVVAIARMSDAAEESDRVQQLLAKHSIGAVMAGLILAYLFKANVLRHFYLEKRSRLAMVIKLIAAAAVFVFVLNLVAWASR